MKQVLVVVLMLVLLAAVGVGSYLVGQSNGLTEAQNIRSEFFQSRSGTTSTQSGSGQTGTGVRSQAGRPAASGAIQSIQGEVLVLTQQDGSSVTVVLSGQTVIQKITAGTTGDLRVGERISVQGVQATGQVNAQVIQITQSGQ